VNCGFGFGRQTLFGDDGDDLMAVAAPGKKQRGEQQECRQ
jgi:hypothetical protein